MAEARSDETFVALCLLTVTGASLLTQKLGFSDTMGAFVAGVLLAETNYSTQARMHARLRCSSCSPPSSARAGRWPGGCVASAARPCVGAPGERLPVSRLGLFTKTCGDLPNLADDHRHILARHRRSQIACFGDSMAPSCG